VLTDARGGPRFGVPRPPDCTQNHLLASVAYHFGDRARARARRSHANGCSPLSAQRTPCDGIAAPRPLIPRPPAAPARRCFWPPRRDGARRAPALAARAGARLDLCARPRRRAPLARGPRARPRRAPPRPRRRRRACARRARARVRARRPPLLLDVLRRRRPPRLARPRAAHGAALARPARRRARRRRGGLPARQAGRPPGTRATTSPSAAASRSAALAPSTAASSSTPRAASRGR
jgi:hypothetical protein